MNADHKKIRILHVVDGFRMGGAENKLLELIACLDPSRYDNCLANVGPTGPLAPHFRALDIPVFQCQRRHRFDVRPVLQLRRIMREQHIDVVQNTLFWADVVGSLAAWLAGVPVVFSWETVTHEGDPYHGKWERRFGYNLAMRFTKAVIAVSHEIKESLIRRRRLAAEKIRVIHYGVDLEKFHMNGQAPSVRRELGIGSEETVIGIVARLEDVKGHRYFLDAFGEIARQHPGVRAVFAGDGSCRQALEQQVIKAGFADRVQFLGIRKDVAAVLNAIDFFVLPSIAGEGLPNVILEAMACGKPIIATTVGGTPEAVRDGVNGYLVAPRDVIGLRTAIEKLLADRGKIATFGAASRRIAEEEFSLQKEIANFERIYEEFYGESRTG